jgi:hypothetical protein
MVNSNNKKKMVFPLFRERLTTQNYHANIATIKSALHAGNYDRNNIPLTNKRKNKQFAFDGRP